MTLEEAIKILKLTPEYTGDGEPIGEPEARKLGIEAMERVRDTRNKSLPTMFTLLPSETLI
jgi:hypothetical protein